MVRRTVSPMTTVLHLAGRLILVLAIRVDLRVPVASSAAF
jgi:hypothetical protein